jgi:VWFA-related protein
MNRVSIFFAIFLFSFALLAQDAPASHPQPQAGAAASVAAPVTPATPDRHITLDLQVTDKSGAPVRGLHKEDFTLLENSKAQTIASFHAIEGGFAAKTDPPQELILVIDAVNSPTTAILRERAEVKQFLLRNDGKLALPTSIISLSSTETRMQGPSQDGNALAAELDKSGAQVSAIRAGEGFDGQAERLHRSLKALTSILAYEQKWESRKLMVWFSPAWPQLQHAGFSNDQRQKLFNSIVAFSTGLRKARITLYAVDPFGVGSDNAPSAPGRVSINPPEQHGGRRSPNSGDLLGVGNDMLPNAYYEGFLKPVASPQQAEAGNVSLQVLAVQSGGRVVISKNDLAATIANCMADADSFYVLSFEAAPAAHANEYRSLRVNAGAPKLTVRTRAGYYAEP